MVCRKLFTLLLFFPVLAGCTEKQVFESSLVTEAQVTDRTRAGELLEMLPPPREKIAVSLYDFQDQTGQFKYNDKYTDYSSAVTKGGLAILTKALLDAGNKRWFTVTERGGLKNLLQERQIIKIMRNEYRTSDGNKLPELPPLIYGGMLIEGGIISYDSNIITGGVGAIYLGIGGNVQYHRDVVTVALRAISIQSGEVLLSVTSSKTIFSTAIGSNVLKYITFDRLLQAEAGFSVNEPTQLGVRQAIETAVYSMIMEGAISHVWEFADYNAGRRAISEYITRRDGPPPMQQPGLAPPRKPMAQADRQAGIFEQAMNDGAYNNGAYADLAPAAGGNVGYAEAARTQPVIASALPPQQQPYVQARQPDPVAVPVQAAPQQQAQTYAMAQPPAQPVARPVQPAPQAVKQQPAPQPLPVQAVPPPQNVASVQAAPVGWAPFNRDSDKGTVSGYGQDNSQDMDRPDQYSASASRARNYADYAPAAGKKGTSSQKNNDLKADARRKNFKDNKYEMVF